MWTDASSAEGCGCASAQIIADVQVRKCASAQIIADEQVRKFCSSKSFKPGFVVYDHRSAEVRCG